MTEHFLEHAVSQRPLFLLLDGHSTHYQPEVIRLAREKEVIILCLPPHTTHETQPLDCGVFSSLKSHWTTVCHEFIAKNPGKTITKFNFNSLFSKAWLQAVVPSNLISGFRTLYHPQFLPDEVLNDLSVLAHISSVSPQTPLLICNEEASLPPASMFPAIASSKDVTTGSTTSSGSDSTVSKFLVHPTDNTPVRTIQKPIPRARLLTSAASLAAIEKKVKQKQEQLEEKQRKRREREEKKKQKEQELKRKEEERAKKAEEKARKTKTNTTKKVTQDKKEQAQRGKRRKPLDFEQDIPQAKKSMVTEDGVCCICFGGYDDDVIERTGAEWIACGCGRWLHEDCVEDVVLDDEGNERFCVFCLM